MHCGFCTEDMALECSESKTWDVQGARLHVRECTEHRISSEAGIADPGKGPSHPTRAPVATAALSTAARTRGQPRRPSAEDWVKKMRPVYTVEHHSAIAMSEAVPFAEMRVDPETIIQSEVHKEKTTYCILMHIRGL